jgi:hypothetical protein
MCIPAGMTRGESGNDFQEKKVLVTRGGREETTKVERIERQGGMWILQGVEFRGWTITVSEVTGKMVL